MAADACERLRYEAIANPGLPHRRAAVPASRSPLTPTQKTA